jgi:LysR family transcriptional regulator AphB
VTGLGIALLPEALILSHLRDGRLVVVLPDHCVKGLDLYLVYLNRRQLPRAVSVFIEFAVAKLVATGLFGSVPTSQEPALPQSAWGD